MAPQDLTLVDATAGLADEDKLNGQYTPPAPPAVAVESAPAQAPEVTITRGQRGKQKTALIKFAGDHDGFWARVWTNPKRKLFRDLGSGDEERSDTALAAMVLEHNFVDDEGQPMPQPLTYEALGDLGQDLYQELGESIGEAVKQAGELSKRG